MFALFRFNLPLAVTEQLLKKIGELESTPLSQEALAELYAFQQREHLCQGVYLLFLQRKVAYVGKSDNVFSRLTEHWEKVRGRRNLKLSDVSFKCLLLDDNWRPSANEGLLIDHYRNQGECEWNLGGFGPKDPGRNRDGAIPSDFDTRYPIDEDFKLTLRPESTERASQLNDKCATGGLPQCGPYTAGDLLALVKEQVPFLLRFRIDSDSAGTIVKLDGTLQTAGRILQQIARSLGPEWQLMLFKSHMTLYRERKTYAYGTQLHP
jgi:hypothetical protein